MVPKIEPQPSPQDGMVILARGQKTEKTIQLTADGKPSEVMTVQSFVFARRSPRSNHVVGGLGIKLESGQTLVCGVGPDIRLLEAWRAMQILDVTASVRVGDNTLASALMLGRSRRPDMSKNVRLWLRSQQNEALVNISADFADRDTMDSVILNASRAVPTTPDFMAMIHAADEGGLLDYVSFRNIKTEVDKGRLPNLSVYTRMQTRDSMERAKFELVHPSSVRNFLGAVRRLLRRKPRERVLAYVPR